MAEIAGWPDIQLLYAYSLSWSLSVPCYMQLPLLARVAQRFSNSWLVDKFKGWKRLRDTWMAPTWISQRPLLITPCFDLFRKCACVRDFVNLVPTFVPELYPSARNLTVFDRIIIFKTHQSPILKKNFQSGGTNNSISDSSLDKIITSKGRTGF